MATKKKAAAKPAAKAKAAAPKAAAKGGKAAAAAPKKGKGVIKLARPPGPGEHAWHERFYEPDSQKARDRLLFSR